MAAAFLASALAMPIASMAQDLLPDLARMAAALRHYEAISAAGGWANFPSGTSLKPGAFDTRVPALRERLRAEGDYGEKATAADLAYDQALEQSVRRFQMRHGLVIDGIVGPKTRAALNASAEHRAAGLRRNLARIRDLAPWPQRFVLVQAPAFEAAAIEHGAEVLRSRVIVGRKTRQTPELRSAIREVVFNPYWTVPIRIARRDIAPKVLEDPRYLADRGIRVFASWASGAPEIDPATVDWSTLPTTIKLRQDPGPENALGQVKFLFPNPYDVYLHDTPNRGLFDALPRAFSSGCVRLDRAVDLAVWILGDQQHWPDNRVHAAAASGARKSVRLETPIPVIFTYLTAWVGRDGLVQFRNDLYARDKSDNAPNDETSLGHMPC